MFKSNTCLQTVKYVAVCVNLVVNRDNEKPDGCRVASVFVLRNKCTSYSMILHIGCNILTCECKIVNCEFVGSWSEPRS